jgi:hypothetical protein
MTISNSGGTVYVNAYEISLYADSQNGGKAEYNGSEIATQQWVRENAPKVFVQSSAPTSGTYKAGDIWIQTA